MALPCAMCEAILESVKRGLFKKVVRKATV